MLSLFELSNDTISCASLPKIMKYISCVIFLYMHNCDAQFDPLQPKTFFSYIGMSFWWRWEVGEEDNVPQLFTLLWSQMLSILFTFQPCLVGGIWTFLMFGWGKVIFFSCLVCKKFAAIKKIGRGGNECSGSFSFILPQH